MFKVNDVVMYASYGVCEIAAIEEKDFSGENVEYYILRPISDSRNTFYVPTNKEALTQQMRRVYTKSEVEELIKAIPDAKLINIDDEEKGKIPRDHQRRRPRGAYKAHQDPVQPQTGACTAQQAASRGR